MKGPAATLLLLACALAFPGCMSPGVDEPDRVRLANHASERGEATLRFRDPQGAVADSRTLHLEPGSVHEFFVNLTSEVHYRADLQVGERVRASEPFFTGLGEWRVDLTLQDDVLHVTTLHGD